jgi:hypothetical protein
VKETPAAFRARAGLPYLPRVAGARPLADDEPCPTLFRYPGPAALLEALARALPPLAAPGSEVLWLAVDPLAAAPAARFGSLALLEPLRLSPAVVEQAFAAAARADVDEERVVWIPPSRIAAGGEPWDAVATRADARALLGPGWEDERARLVDELAGYLEEMAELARAGAPAPGVPWCEIPATERARLLAEHGLRGRWTR